MFYCCHHLIILRAVTWPERCKHPLPLIKRDEMSSFPSYRAELHQKWLQTESISKSTIFVAKVCIFHGYITSAFRVYNSHCTTIIFQTCFYIYKRCYHKSMKNKSTFSHFAMDSAEQFLPEVCLASLVVVDVNKCKCLYMANSSRYISLLILIK